MKYSEFLELKEILESDGITIDEFKNISPEELNEGFFGFIGGKIADAIKTGMTNLISMGISNNMITKLNTNSVEIVKLVSSQLKGKQDVIKALDKNIKLYKEQWKKKNKATEVPEEISRKLENKKNKEVVKFINKQVELYSSKVKDTITNRTRLTDENRKELLNYWEQLMTKVRIDVSGELIKYGILDEEDSKAYWKRMREESKKAKTEVKPPITKPEEPEKIETPKTEKPTEKKRGEGLREVPFK